MLHVLRLDLIQRDLALTWSNVTLDQAEIRDCRGVVKSIGICGFKSACDDLSQTLRLDELVQDKAQRRLLLGHECGSTVDLENE
jgi:hypothetical protein